MVPGEQFPIISAKQQLEQAGFSNDEVSHLLMLKARYQQGIHDWGTSNRSGWNLPDGSIRMDT